MQFKFMDLELSYNSIDLGGHNSFLSLGKTNISEICVQMSS